MAISHPDWREMARESMARADIELASSEDQRLRYAALELRYALEALIYDLAWAYRAEIPPEEYKIWQARKLLNLLLTIDPTAGSSSTLLFGKEHEYGVSQPRDEMKIAGKEFRISAATLKTHYDALGHYLHAPSLKDVMEHRLQDADKLRTRCEEVREAVSRVLSSRIWSSTMGLFAILSECMNEDCRRPVRLRLNPGVQRWSATCFHCGAEYSVTDDGSKGPRWEPETVTCACATAGCGGKMDLWTFEIKPGTNWKCRECGERSVLRIGVFRCEG